MGEKIAKTGIRHDKTLLYYIHNGDIWAAPAGDIGQKVAVAGIDEDNATYLYYVDEDGDVARRRKRGRENSPSLLVALEKQLEVARAALGRVDALAAHAAEQFDIKGLRSSDPVQANRMSHLMSHLMEATVEAAGAAASAVSAISSVCAMLGLRNEGDEE